MKKKKFVSGYSTTVVHAIWKKFSRHSTINDKDIFVSGYSTMWCMGLKIKLNGYSTTAEKKSVWLQYYYGAWELEKNSIGTLPPPKKKYFCFWLQYYYDLSNFKKFNRHLTLEERKTFLLCKVLHEHRAWDLEKLNRYSTPNEKINIFFWVQNYYGDLPFSVILITEKRNLFLGPLLVLYYDFKSATYPQRICFNFF